MNMEIVSREKIKPDSPTPSHLKIHKLSLLDQIIFPVYTPLILYFAPDLSLTNSDQSISQKIHHLKTSLASTLSTFYPFAGVIKDALSVDCDDRGLPFSVAKVQTRIKDFLQRPDILLLINDLLPGEVNSSELPGPGDSVCIIQLNCFDCGGIALSLLFWHSAADGSSVCTFLKAWAASTRGSCAIAPLNCIAQSAFPQKLALPRESNPFASYEKLASISKCTTRRYVFDASSISILKAQSEDLVPSRVQVVTALILKCFMDSAGNNDGKPSVVVHNVNLRRRADPPFPGDSFGNFLWPTLAVRTRCSVECSKELVSEVRRGISRIDKEFIKRLQTYEGYCENLEDCKKAIPEEANMLCFTGLVNMGLYDVDLGWGRPVWLSSINVSSASSDFLSPNNFVILVDTRTGDGIEAWVFLDTKYVAGFEKNEELKMLARFNPNVLGIRDNL